MPKSPQVQAWLDRILWDPELDDSAHITSVAMAEVAIYENGEFMANDADLLAYMEAHYGEIVAYIEAHPSRTK